MRKNGFFKKRTVLLLAAAAVLLCGSAVGSARAALTYYSENYVAGIETSSIGVSLVENGVETDVLLANMLEEDERLTLGKDYAEAICVANTGSVDSYVRVILTKSWKDAEGKKDTTLSPALIDLNLLEGNGWVVDASAETAERTVLYYGGILPAGAVSSAISDVISIDPAVGTKVIQTVKEDTNGKIISYEYEYDGYTAHIDAEVDAVQTHNAADAIKSAWGVDVNISEDGSLSLR